MNAAVESDIVALSWRYIPTVLASCMIMLGWALIINNLGRRRYPLYLWAPGKTFVSTTPAGNEKEIQKELREAEAGLRSTEGALFDPANDTGEGSEGNNKVLDGSDQAGNSATNGAN